VSPWAPGSDLSRREACCLAAVAFVMGLSLVLAFVAPEYFETSFTEEDHFIENLTVVALVAGAAVCAYRIWSLRRRRHGLFVTATVLLGLVYVFGAGEEISWGQRLFHVRAPAFFAARNAQHETNLHNLVVRGVELKSIAEHAQSVVLIGYLLLLPLACRHWARARATADALAIPVPRLRQSIGFALVYFGVVLIPSVRGGEVYECAGAMMMFVITTFPANRRAFARG
jgi:lysylphosphatidylglycerol synthetase-like protein (DUF2156 family)